MKSKTGFFLFVILCQLLQAENNFHSFKSLYVQATIGSHFDLLAGSSIDPRIGVLWTYPVFYNFLHVDLSAELSPRPFLAPDYSTTSDNEHFKNSPTSYIGKSWVWDQKGVEAVMSFAPTVYLRHFYFGICETVGVEYIAADYRHIMLNKVTLDTVYKNTERGVQGFNFDQYLPGIKLGWRFTNFSLFSILHPGLCSVSYSQKIWFHPSKNKKLRTSVYDE